MLYAFFWAHRSGIFFDVSPVFLVYNSKNNAFLKGILSKVSKFSASNKNLGGNLFDREMPVKKNGAFGAITLQKSNFHNPSNLIFSTKNNNDRTRNEKSIARGLMNFDT